MKKLPLIVVFAVISVTAVLAQSNSASNANQGQFVGQESVATVDFLWRISQLGTGSPLSMMEYLFPYEAWYLNPSAVTGFKKKTVLSYLTYSGSGTTTTATHNTAVGGGAVGGTDVTTTASHSGTLDLAGFMPIGNNMVAGAEAYFRGSGTPSSDVYTNFNANPQNLTVDHPSNSTSYWNGDGSFGMPLGPLEFGASVSYSGSSTPAKNQFTEYTDKNAAGGKPYYTGGPYSDTNTTDLFGRVGAKMPYQKFTIGMSAFLNHYINDQSKQFVAVDENGDGYAETMVSYSTYATSTATWGLGLSTYSHVNTSTFTDLLLFPSVSYQLKSNLTLILDGYWTPIEHNSTDLYTHTTSTDKSDATTLTKSGLDNFQAIAGVDFKPLASLDLRAGIGLGHSKSSFSQTNLNAAGTSTYASGNTNNYTEQPNFYGAAQPNYGDVVSLGGTPTTTVNTSYLALVSVSWTPFQRVTLFAGSAFSDSSATQTYNVYDTTTNTVWTETSSSGSGNWALNSLIGVAVQVTKDFALSLTTNDVAVNGSLGSSTQGLPTSGGTKSTGITTDSSKSTNSSIGATISGVVTF